MQAPIRMSMEHAEPSEHDESEIAGLLHNVDEWPRTRVKRLSWLITATSVLASALMGISAVIYAAVKQPTDSQCAARMSAYSPALDAGVVEYKWQNNEAQFGQQSVYTGYPTKAVEDAWDELWYYGAVNIPQDKLSLLNKTNDRSRKMVDQDKGGGYAGMIEVFHQLHCLNFLRQYSWGLDTYEKEFGGRPVGFEGGEDQIRGHLDHCIEYLRINLMCTSDVTPFLLEYDASAPHSKRADLSTRHKCRNFDKIRDWLAENVVA